MKKFTSLIFILILAFLTASCSNTPASSQQDQIKVITSIYPLYEFAQLIGGDRIQVELLLPPAADAHDWEPSASEVKKISLAKLFLYNGGGVEPWAERLKAGIGEEKVEFIQVGEGLFKPSSSSYHQDPHIWLDPILVQSQVEVIKAALLKIDPAGKEIYEKNAQDFLAALLALDQDYQALARQTQGSSFVVMHAAFGYLAERYGWQQVPLLGLAPHAEPNPAQIAKIMKIVQEHQLEYIFVESQVSNQVMQEIATETNTNLLYLDTLELPPENQAETYLSRMKRNLVNLSKAFEVAK